MKPLLSATVCRAFYCLGFVRVPIDCNILFVIYAGGDFIAAQMLSDNEQERIYSTAKTISEKLLNIGYLGPK